MPTWMMGAVPFLSHGMDSISNSLTLFIMPSRWSTMCVAA
jgi:hypothetical protein